MSTKEEFNDDVSFGDNTIPHQASLPQWYQNYYAPGQPAVSGALPMTHFNNHFDVNLNRLDFNNFDNNYIGNLSNAPASHNFNPYAALRAAQLPHPYLGHLNNMLLPFGQLPQNEYYATPALGLPTNSMVPRTASPFTYPQLPIVPSTENWEVTPTTPMKTVRLETISPDVLRGQYTRPVESGFQPFSHTTNYDSSYRHFELQEHEHELSVPPTELHDARAGSQFSHTPAPYDGEEEAISEDCFAQCANTNDEDLIGCRNGSCVVAFHPECVKLGAREDGLPACPSCLSVVDSSLLGLLNLGQHHRATSAPSRSQSASLRATQSPPRATPALSVGSSFHPSPSPAPQRRRATTPQHRAIKIESNSPPTATDLFGSYKDSIALPDGYVSARGLNNKGAWTAEEDAACIRVMRNLLAIHSGNRRIAVDTLWQRASEALAKEGVERSSSGIKMQWTRRLRAQSGVDERAVPRPDLLCTGLLKKGVPRKSRGYSYIPERTTPPATPTTRRSTKLRGTAAQTSHLTATQVKASRIVKLKIGAGTANGNPTAAGGRRGRGGPRKAKAKAQKKIETVEAVEDVVSPIMVEHPDEGISMHGRAVTPALQQDPLQQEMDIDMEWALNDSPSSSSFEEALEDTLMDRGYVMEE